MLGRLAKLGSLAVAVSVAALTIAVPSAGAVTTSLTPGFQTVYTGSPATWGLAWGNSAPYNVTFTYGDGMSWSKSNTSSTSKGLSHTFSYCINTNRTQTLTVHESGGGTGTATSTTRVLGAGAC